MKVFVFRLADRFIKYMNFSLVKGYCRFILKRGGVLFLVASCFTVNAQFTISSEIRPRTEYRHGFKKLIDDSDPAFFTEQRSRLNLSYQNTKFKSYFVLQDVRIWGETAQINKTDGLTSIHEAWGEMLFSKRFSAKVGRQELVYDDHRMLGNLEWAAQARSHDALLLKYADSTFTIHSGFAFNQDTKVPEPTKLTGNFYSAPGGFATLGGGLPNYKNMQFIWFQKLLGKSQITGLLMNTGWQMADTTTNYLFTAGLNPSIALGKNLRFLGSYYQQVGYDRFDHKVNASLLSAALQFNYLKKLPFTLGADIVSGASPGRRVYRAFDPLFGTNHAFYGHMDYFYVGNSHSQQGATIGLIDFFAKTTLKTGKKSSLLVHLHDFFSQVDIIDPDDAAMTISSSLGQEIDMIFNYDFDKAVNIKLGYSQLFATRSLGVIKGGDYNRTQNWAWLMFSFKPVLFSTSVNN